MTANSLFFFFLANSLDVLFSQSWTRHIHNWELFSVWPSLFIFYEVISATAKSFQSCPTLCYPIDGSPPGSPVPGILQARILEWVAISSSNVWKWKVKVKSLSRVRLIVTPWTAAHQAPPSIGFSRQECWSGVPLPSLLLVIAFNSSPVAYWTPSNLGGSPSSYLFAFSYWSWGS